MHNRIIIRIRNQEGERANMWNYLSSTEEEFSEIYERNINTVWHICMSYLKNKEDTQDVVQETFLKLYKFQGNFSSKEHEKAWLIVTASNLCKDMLKHWWRRRENIEDHKSAAIMEPFQTDTTLEEVLKLPDRYKIVVYLYYYEGYNSTEIGKILHRPGSTIRNYLQKAKSILKTKLGDDFDEK